MRDRLIHIIKRLFRGAAACWLSKELVERGLPADMLGPLGDALGVSLGTGVCLGLDKGIREWWANRKS